MLPAVRPVETPSECPAPEICIDDYLWALYERTPKIDTNKVLERVRVKAKVTIKKKNKTRTVTKTTIKTNTKYVAGDFTWKDPIAAKRAGMSLKDYVIGGMDPGFKLQAPPRTSRHGRRRADARLNERISGRLSAVDRKRQQGRERQLISRREPPRRLRPRSCGRSRKRQRGHPISAICLEPRAVEVDRCARERAWIGRPYLDRDPPHVAPLDGAEYGTKRVRAIAQTGELQSQKRRRLAEQR